MNDVKLVSVPGGLVTAFLPVNLFFLLVDL